MHKTDEFICMSTTFTIYRYYQMFPKKGTELNPGKGFYIKYTFACVLASVVLDGSLLHLINTIRSNEYNHMELDLTYMVSMIGAYLLNSFFFLKTGAAAKMLIFLSNFQEFGKPIEFDKTNDLFNTISKYHYAYLLCILTSFLLTSEFFNIEQCNRENLEYGFHEVCGLLTYTWMPFEIDYFPVKQIYAALQLFSIYYLYLLAGINAFSVLEIVEHIATRLDHIKYLFVKAIEEGNHHMRRRKFAFAVRYHIRVLHLEEELNECFSLCMLTHMTLTGAILGCGVYGFSQAKSIPSLLVSVGWLIGLVIICTGGQRLSDKSLEVGSALYNSNWCGVEAALKRDIVIVLMRSQKPMILRAAAFGIMNHAMIVIVAKASYSYITLLGQTT